VSLADVQHNLLDASDISLHQIEQTFALFDTHQVDYADMYFQSSQHEAWVLEDGIIKNGSYNIERGVGVRAISGEKTGFAYSDDINLTALKDAAKAARGIAPKLDVTPARKHLQSRDVVQKYMRDNPLLAMAEEEKIALLKACDQYIRAQAPNAEQVSVSITGV
jgi:TldD protein